MHTFETVMVALVLLIVGVHHIASLMYELLRWPRWLVRHFDHRLQENVRRVLTELGVDEHLAEDFRRADLIRRIQAGARFDDPRVRCMNLLRTALVRGEHTVGVGQATMFPYFIDVQSSSLNGAVADECATILLSFLRERQDFPKFDVVVGIKRGSPQIAVRLAEKLKRKCAVFRGSGDFKYDGATASPLQLFDGALMAGETALIVDDSSTGGRMVLDCVEALRSAGCTVGQCLVLFEPIGKNARSYLFSKGVALVAVTTLDDEAITELLRNP